MKQQADITGVRFNRLVAQWPVGMTQFSHTRGATWLCLCDCGQLVIATLKLLKGKAGARKGSCGCLRKEWLETGAGEMLKKLLPAKTHGHWIGGQASPEWYSWQCMRSRCYYQKDQDYHAYGARGIRVADRWKDSFENFLADMGPRPEGKTLDRYPNPDGNYEPGNCRWATPLEQRRNWRSGAMHKAKAATV